MSGKSKVPAIAEIKKNLQHLFDALEHEEDTICVIVGTAFVDHYLGALLAKFLIDSESSASLLDSQGPTGTLITKAKFAYCLGLISKGCFNTITTVAQIRNQFAHKLNVSQFEANAKVTDLCKNFKPPLGMAIEFSVNETEGQPVDLSEFVAGRIYLPNDRGLFMMNVELLCVYLELKVLATVKCNRLEDQWDQVDDSK